MVRFGAIGGFVKLTGKSRVRGSFSMAAENETKRTDTIDVSRTHAGSPKQAKKATATLVDALTHCVYRVQVDRMAVR
jgi:hypothetical protein